MTMIMFILGNKTLRLKDSCENWIQDREIGRTKVPWETENNNNLNKMCLVECIKQQQHNVAQCKNTQHECK